MKNRGMAARAVAACARDGCLVRVLHGDIAKAKAPPLKASWLRARAQENRLCGCASVLGRTMQGDGDAPENTTTLMCRDTVTATRQGKSGTKLDAAKRSDDTGSSPKAPTARQKEEC